MAKVRIQKLLSESGVASRRAVEDMILNGRVTVNGELVTSLPCFVDPREDEIRVDNRPVRKRPAEPLYFLLNKPKGVVSTQSDERGRPRAVDLLPIGGDQRVYSVGGLDAETTGLVLLTNDGELTQMLTHPRHGVARKYVAEIDGQLTPEQIAELKQGVRIEGQRQAGLNVRVELSSPVRSFVELELTSPRHVDIRRSLDQLGHPVKRLKRVTIGPLSDKGLKVGHHRPLTPREVEQLKAIVRVGGGKGPSRRRGGRGAGGKRTGAGRPRLERDQS